MTDIKPVETHRRILGFNGQPLNQKQCVHKEKHIFTCFKACKYLVVDILYLI